MGSLHCLLYNEIDIINIKNDISRLKPDVIVPIDLPSLWACEEYGIKYRLPTSIRDLASERKIFKLATEHVTCAIFDNSLFDLKYREINPLYAVAHWLVALLGNSIIKLKTIEEIASFTDGRVVLVEYRDRVPYVCQYHDFCKSKSTRSISKNKIKPIIQAFYNRAYTLIKSLGIKVRLGRLKSSSDGLLTLYLSFWNSDNNRLLEDNKNLSLFNMREFTIPSIPIGKRQKVLPEVLKKISLQFYKEFTLEVTEHEYVSSLLNAYNRIGDEFEESLAIATLDVDKKYENTVLLTAPSIKMKYRAACYHAWRSGAFVAFEVYADSEMVGLFDYDWISYRTAISGINYYRGVAAVLDRKNLIRCQSVPKKYHWETLAIGGDGRVHYQIRGSKSGRRVLFIPTSFTGNARHGPQRDAHDIYYWETQLDVLKTLAALDTVEVIYKAHPKNFVKMTPYVRAVLKNIGVEYIDRPICRALIDTADCVVTDKLGSGIGKVLESNIAIVLVDRGVDELLPEVIPFAKKRLEILDINRENWMKALQEVIEHILSNRVRNESRTFSTLLTGAGSNAKNSTVLTDLYHRTLVRKC